LRVMGVAKVQVEEHKKRRGGSSVLQHKYRPWKFHCPVSFVDHFPKALQVFIVTVVADSEKMDKYGECCKCRKV
jgi:hypothetical protein